MPSAAQRRNVVLLGRAGAGKTTLVRALDPSGTTPHAPPAPQTLGIPSIPALPTAKLTLTPVEHRGVTVNLLDTPGALELVGARVAGMRAGDAALFVVPAVGGLDPLTARLWHLWAREQRPRAVVLTHVDAFGADVDEALALCRRVFEDEELHAVTLPVHDDDGTVAGVLDLLTLQLLPAAGSPRPSRPAEPEHVELVAGVRQDLVEAVLADSDDPQLLDHYLAGALDGADEQVRHALHDAVRRGAAAPVLPVVAGTGVGLTQLLDLVVDGFPDPAQAPCPAVCHADGSPAEPLHADPAGPLVAEVVRGGSDPLARIWSGTLRAGAEAGSVVTLDALDAETVSIVGDSDLCLTGWSLPDPLHPVAVRAPVEALEAAVRADPSLRLDRRGPAGQVLLWCQGPEHARLTLDALRSGGHDVVAEPERLEDGTESESVFSIEVLVPATYGRKVAAALSRHGSQAARAPDAEHDDDVRVRSEVSLSSLAQLAADLLPAAHGTAHAALRPLPDADALMRLP